MDIVDFFDKELRAFHAKVAALSSDEQAAITSGSLQGDAPPHVSQFGPGLQLFATESLTGCLSRWDRDRREGEKQRATMNAATAEARKVQQAELAKKAAEDTKAKAAEAERVAAEAAKTAAAAKAAAASAATAAASA